MATQYHFTVTNETIEVKRGKHASPNITITMKESDYLDMVNGKLNGQMAFMTGKLKIAGDMGLALKLKYLFQQRSAGSEPAAYVLAVIAGLDHSFNKSNAQVLS